MEHLPILLSLICIFFSTCNNQEGNASKSEPNAEIQKFNICGTKLPIELGSSYEEISSQLGNHLNMNDWLGTTKSEVGFLFDTIGIDENFIFQVLTLTFEYNILKKVVINNYGFNNMVKYEILLMPFKECWFYDQISRKLPSLSNFEQLEKNEVVLKFSILRDPQMGNGLQIIYNYKD